MLRVFLLSCAAIIAFASNSLLCRLALKQTSIDPASFTCLRIISGAAALSLIVILRTPRWREASSWPSAVALFVYAATFSFAYVGLSAGTGALLLFGAVQATMILTGLRRGERLSVRQLAGLILALAGLLVLVLPGLSAPPLTSSFLMISAGIAWGVYSLRGKTTTDAIGATAGNFIRAVPLAVVLGGALLPWSHFDSGGAAYAAASGALASGAGYVIWYLALPALRAATAATIQLSVPVIAAIGGILLLGETFSQRLLIASMAILGGISLVVIGRSARTSTPEPARQ